ncbi:aldo/keto reductase [bacterium]|nr:aldo/keto reductase [bacterium]
MQYSDYPHLREKVSRIGFGAFGLGGVFGAFDRGEAIEALHSSWEQGVNFLDTARHYGESEAIIAEALKSWSDTRPFIATKAETVGPLVQWAIPQPVESCFPRGHVTREAETSLRVLGVDCLDLFQMHLYWPNWGIEGYWLDELEALVAEGKIRSIGVSLPDQRHDIALPLVLSGRIHCVQTVFNIFDPKPLDCLIPICEQSKVAVIARCVLDEGGLTGMLTMDTKFGDGDYRAKYFDAGPRETYIEKVDALRKFIPEHASSLAALALKFVLHHPGVTTAVSSMHIKRFAEENIRAADEAGLSNEVFEDIRRHYRWIRNFYGQKVL